MMKFLRKHRYTIFIVVVTSMVVGSFLSFGGSHFNASPQDAAIIVNGHKIPYSRYQTRYRQYVQQQKDAQTPPAVTRQNVINDLVKEEVLMDEADKYGINVTDGELAAYIQGVPAFQRDGKFDQGSYQQVVMGMLGMRIEDFEKERRREIKIQKMQHLMSSAVKISPLEFNIALQKRLAMAKPEEKKKIQENPQALREEIKQEQVSQAFQHWLGQLNSQLKIKVLLERWEGKAQG